VRKEAVEALGKLKMNKRTANNIQESGGKMRIEGRKYQAMVSSDWNECLAPTGPFDPVSFHYPDLTSELSGVFKK